MRKIIVAISMLLVVAMTLAVPAFAAEEVSTAAVELEKYGQKTYIVGEAIDEAPIVDGLVEEGEYSYMVKIEDPVTFTTSQNYNQKAEAPAEAWMTSEYVEYYYAWDEDNIYVAFVDKHGFKDNTNWVYRNNYAIRMGFNLGDFSEYIELGLAGNNGDYTSVAEKPSIGMTTAMSNTAVPDEEKSLVAAYATKTSIDEAFEGKATDPTEWVRTYEMTINKAQMLAIINFYCGTNYAELPNAMLFTVGHRTYPEFTEVAQANYLDCTHSLWNCALLSDEQMAELNTEFIYVPNVVVFGTELKVPAIAEEVPEDEETEPVEDEETEPVEDEETEPVETEDTAAQSVADTEAPKAGGCGSSVTFASMALVAALGSCAVIVSKKRR